MFQFAHNSNGAGDEATSKNAALAQAGAVVPDSFDDLHLTIREVYSKLARSGPSLKWAGGGCEPGHSSGTAADCPESEDGRNTGQTEQILEDIEKLENSTFTRDMDTSSSIGEHGLGASCGASVLGSVSIAVGGQEALGDRIVFESASNENYSLSVKVKRKRSNYMNLNSLNLIYRRRRVL